MNTGVALVVHAWAATAKPAGRLRRRRHLLVNGDEEGLQRPRGDLPTLGLGSGRCYNASDWLARLIFVVLSSASV